MAKSRKSDSGCLSSVLRHLLCRNGIPTCPSTELHHAPIKTDEGDSLEARGKEAAASSSSDRPGIVARLMGLETLPGDPSWAPKFRKSPNHVPRSRSVNFMDYLLEIDFGRVSDTRHRRVRTSVSFRESAPSLPCQQSLQPDLLVLYLDELESKPKKEARSKLSGQEPGLGDRKPKDRRRDGAGRELKVSKLRNEPRSVSKEAQHGRKNGSQRGKLIQEKEMMAESKFTKKRKEGKAVKRVAIVPVESDGSEASSPMSVLNLDEWANEQGTSTVQEVPECVTLSPKKETSPPSKFLPPARISDSLDRRGSSRKEVCDPVSSSYARQKPDYCQSVATEVYGLTQEDISRNSTHWVNLIGREDEDFRKLCEEISTLIEHRVLEQMVCDLCAI